MPGSKTVLALVALAGCRGLGEGVAPVTLEVAQPLRFRQLAVRDVGMLTDDSVELSWSDGADEGLPWATTEYRFEVEPPELASVSAAGELRSGFAPGVGTVTVVAPDGRRSLPARLLVLRPFLLHDDGIMPGEHGIRDLAGARMTAQYHRVGFPIDAGGFAPTADADEWFAVEAVFDQARDGSWALVSRRVGEKLKFYAVDLSSRSAFEASFDAPLEVPEDALCVGGHGGLLGSGDAGWLHLFPGCAGTAVVRVGRPPGREVTSWPELEGIVGTRPIADVTDDRALLFDMEANSHVEVDLGTGAPNELCARPCDWARYSPDGKVLLTHGFEDGFAVRDGDGVRRTLDELTPHFALVDPAVDGLRLHWMGRILQLQGWGTVGNDLAVWIEFDEAGRAVASGISPRCLGPVWADRCLADAGMGAMVVDDPKGAPRTLEVSP